MARLPNTAKFATPGLSSETQVMGLDLAGVAVENDGHIAVAFAHRGLIDQQHPTQLAAAVLGHQRRPHVKEVLDQMPVEAMAANHGSDGHDLGVSNDLASQTPG